MLTHISNIQHTNSGNFFLIAGPCAIEGTEMALEIAKHTKSLSSFRNSIYFQRFVPKS